MPGLRLTEIFHSLQGEGQEVGLPTVFIRLTGCSLRCSWCDTTYSFQGGEGTTVEDVVKRVEAYPTRRACVTGGEPMDQGEACVALMDALLARGWTIQLETSGAIDLAPVNALPHRERLLVSMDVKCPSSNMQGRNLWSNLAHLRPHDQVKCVIADERDWTYFREFHATHAKDIPCDILLQPMSAVGDTTGGGELSAPSLTTGLKLNGDAVTLRTLAERVLEAGLEVRVGIQLHKLVWGNEPGR